MSTRHLRSPQSTNCFELKISPTDCGDLSSKNTANIIANALVARRIPICAISPATPLGRAVRSIMRGVV